MWWKLWVVFALYGAIFPLNQGLWTCKVEPVRCFDSSTKVNNDENKCCTYKKSIYNQPDYKGPEYGADCDPQTFDKITHYCEVRPDLSSEGTTWLPCDSGCFNDTLSPIAYEDGDVSTFCKTKSVDCIFPFIHNGKTYHNFTSDPISPGDGTTAMFWCATEVDEIGQMQQWGKCDLETCKSVDNSQLSDPKECDHTTSHCAEATISGEGITGKVTFKQSKSESGPLHISGEISGLTEGQHGFHAHEIGTSDCRASGGHFNPSKVEHGSQDSVIRHAGDFGNIEANSEGIAKIEKTIYSGSSLGSSSPNSLIGKTLVIHANEDDLGVNDDEGSKSTGNAGDRVACGIIIQTQSEETKLIFIIIIVLAVIIVVLLILITILVIYCCKNGGKPGIHDPNKPYQNGDPSKPGFGDDLSIPFIDDSPRVTPRVGRSTERLSFFNRTPSIGRSRGSLSNEEAATVK